MTDAPSASRPDARSTAQMRVSDEVAIQIEGMNKWYGSSTCFATST
jgi:hypothetical protein